jgi:HPt (histidine-containing phosphotransfer) domain-containing protein
MAQIEDAVTGQDAEGLDRAAHKLRGAASIFGSHAAMQTAMELETMGRDRNLSNAGELLLQLKTQIEALEDALSGSRQEA